MITWAFGDNSRLSTFDFHGSTEQRFNAVFLLLDLLIHRLLLESYFISFKSLALSSTTRGWPVHPPGIRAPSCPIDSLHFQAEQCRIKCSREPFVTVVSLRILHLVWFSTRSHLRPISESL